MEFENEEDFWPPEEEWEPTEAQLEKIDLIWDIA